MAQWLDARALKESRVRSAGKNARSGGDRVVVFLPNSRSNANGRVTPS